MKVQTCRSSRSIMPSIFDRRRSTCANQKSLTGAGRRFSMSTMSGFIAGLQRGQPQQVALFGIGQERRLTDPPPLGVAFGGQGRHLVEVGAQADRLAGEIGEPV